MNQYATSRDQWERIKDLLPGIPGDVGVTAHHNRRFAEALLPQIGAEVLIFSANSASSAALLRATVKTARNFLAALHLAAATIWLS
jgi:hypothetical protein